MNVECDVNNVTTRISQYRTEQDYIDAIKQLKLKITYQNKQIQDLMKKH